MQQFFCAMHGPGSTARIRSGPSRRGRAASEGAARMKLRWKHFGDTARWVSLAALDRDEIVQKHLRPSLIQAACVTTECSREILHAAMFGSESHREAADKNCLHAEVY